jgi:hypothetical protein
VPNHYRKTFTLNGVEEGVLVGQYVDDCIVAASSVAARTWFTDRLSERFPVNPNSSGDVSLESPGLLLSMQLLYDRERGLLSFNQQAAIESLAKKWDCETASIDFFLFHMSMTYLLDAPQVDIKEYLNIVGSCLHICQVSRPDAAFAIGTLARHSAAPGKIHMDTARDLVSYLCHSRTHSIHYARNF